MGVKGVPSGIRTHDSPLCLDHIIMYVCNSLCKGDWLKCSPFMRVEWRVCTVKFRLWLGQLSGLMTVLQLRYFYQNQEYFATYFSACFFLLFYSQNRENVHRHPVKMEALVMSSTGISNVHVELDTEAATAEQVAVLIPCSMIFF